MLKAQNGKRRAQKPWFLEIETCLELGFWDLGFLKA
jgi:hypothetical protein